ncbi:MAG: hypothetical protein WCR56_07690, partial [Bacilli bacterium]
MVQNTGDIYHTPKADIKAGEVKKTSPSVDAYNVYILASCYAVNQYRDFDSAFWYFSTSNSPLTIPASGFNASSGVTMYSASHSGGTFQVLYSYGSMKNSTIYFTFGFHVTKDSNNNTISKDIIYGSNISKTASAYTVTPMVFSYDYLLYDGLST